MRRTALTARSGSFEFSKVRGKEFAGTICKAAKLCTRRKPPAWELDRRFLARRNEGLILENHLKLHICGKYQSPVYYISLSKHSAFNARSFFSTFIHAAIRSPSAHPSFSAFSLCHFSYPSPHSSSIARSQDSLLRAAHFLCPNLGNFNTRVVSTETIDSPAAITKVALKLEAYASITCSLYTGFKRWIA